MRKIFENRIFRCGESNYYLKDEILSVNQTHTDDNLKAIADSGFNGIWLRVTLRDVAPTTLFQKYHCNSDRYLIRKGKRINKISATERDIIVNELENIKTVLPFVEADSRAGFHQGPQWRMFNPDSIRQKIALLLQIN